MMQTYTSLQKLGIVLSVLLLLSLLGSRPPVHAQTPLDQSFTFQAQLVRDGTLVSATCTFQFQLFDAPTGGTQIGSTLVISDVLVENGDFTVPLTFGVAAFSDERRYLAVAAQCPDDPGFITLDRRMHLRPTPTALHAMSTSWRGLTDVPAGFADGVDNTAAFTIGAGLLLNRNNTLMLDTAATDQRYWRFGGSSDLTAEQAVLGTTNNVSLTLVVNNQAALRLVPTGSVGGSLLPPNLIGGSPLNRVDAGVVGATISGGGEDPTFEGPPARSFNRVVANFGTVGGGTSNQAGNTLSPADTMFATVGGGWGNSASHDSTTVGGGFQNRASNRAATVGGGSNNLADGRASTVSGGDTNRASGAQASVGGGVFNLSNGQRATVSGGLRNRAHADYATISGGGPADPNNPIGDGNQVFDTHGTIAGGGGNIAGSNDSTATNASFATVGGGRQNQALAAFATISGGGPAVLSNPTSTNNRVFDTYGTVGGGGGNVAGSNDSDATNASFATVDGGQSNTASGPRSTIGGGFGNRTTGLDAVVGGGASNTASGRQSTVPGGLNNIASGDHSFAAGRVAVANDSGAFVWADAGPFFIGDELQSPGADTFTVRARGGTRFFSNREATTGVLLAPNTGFWSSLSDRNAKTNFAPVDSRDILARLVGLPITTWSYRDEDSTSRHMGPVAQDFHAAFGLGNDERYIGTIDADGVALVAIQGLHSLIKEKDARIMTLETENTTRQEQIETLQQQNAALEARLTALEQRLGGGTPSSD